MTAIDRVWQLMAPKNDNIPKKVKKGVGLDQAGGESETVSIHINGILRYSKTATIAEVTGDTHRYKTAQGENINHNRALGFKALARRLL